MKKAIKPQTVSRAQEYTEEMASLLNAKTTFIHVSTTEEMRFIDHLLTLHHSLIKVKNPMLYLFDGTGTIKDLAAKATVPPDVKETDPETLRWTTPPLCPIGSPSSVIRWFSRARDESPSQLVENPIMYTERWMVRKGTPMPTTKSDEWARGLNSAPKGSILVLLDQQTSKSLRPGDTGGEYAADISMLRYMISSVPALMEQDKTIIVVSHENKLPPNLKHSFSFIEFPVPDETEVRKMVSRMPTKYCIDEVGKGAQSMKIPGLSMSEAEIEEVVRSLVGMTAAEINRILRMSNLDSAKRWGQAGKFDEPRKLSERVIVSAKMARFSRTNPAIRPVKVSHGLNDVGGYERVKEYLKLDHQLLNPNAHSLGLGYPKGFLVVGPGGTGKTMLASAVAKEWNLPGYVLDIGACRTKWVGESRNNLEEALRIAEDSAPCVTADTRILTEHGELTISELLAMEGGPRIKIPTKNDAGVQVESEILAIVPKGKKGVVAICDEFDNIIHATDNHKFLVRTEEGSRWKEVSELKEGDDLIQFGNIDAEIKSITRIEEPQEVYDLACAAPHTYISNGFVSHNCVLFIDEFEKAWGGGESESMGNSSSDMLATFLTWSQNRRSPVYVIAATNAISSLPPPLIRARRFEALFYAGLPNMQTRSDIFRIHLEMKTWPAAKYNIDCLRLASLTSRYSGAEIEQVIIDGIKLKMRRSLDRDSDPLTTQDIESAISSTRPSADIYPDELRRMEDWVRNTGIQYVGEEEEKKRAAAPADSGNKDEEDGEEISILSIGSIQ